MRIQQFLRNIGRTKVNQQKSCVFCYIWSTTKTLDNYSWQRDSSCFVSVFCKARLAPLVVVAARHLRRPRQHECELVRADKNSASQSMQWSRNFHWIQFLNLAKTLNLISKRTCKYLVPPASSPESWMFVLGVLTSHICTFLMADNDSIFHVQVHLEVHWDIWHRFCISFSSLKSRKKNPIDHGPCGLWKTWVVAWILRMYPGMKSNKVFKQKANGERGHAVNA